MMSSRLSFCKQSPVEALPGELEFFFRKNSTFIYTMSGPRLGDRADFDPPISCTNPCWSPRI